MASCRAARWPRFAIAPLVALALVAGCSSDATPPEVSAALAMAFQERLQTQAESAAARDTPEWPLWRAHLFRVGFEDVDDDLALSEPLRGAIESYWDDNQVLAIPAEASLAEQGALLAAHHRETGERYTAYVTALEKLADADDDETAARGLLAISTTMLQSATQSLYFQYPRLDLLDHVVLDDRYAPRPPACPLYGAGAGGPGTLLDCALPWKERWDIEVAALDEVQVWLDEIEEQDEDSPWRDTVMASRDHEAVRVKPSADLMLPESTSTTPITVATNVVISTRSISVDGVEVVSFQGGIPADAGAVGKPWARLRTELRDRAATARKVATRRPDYPTDLWILQSDVSAPLTLVGDVMALAAEVGLVRPQLAVFPARHSPLLRYSSVLAIPTTFVAQPPRGSTPARGPGLPDHIPLLTISSDGYVLSNPRAVRLPSATPGSWPTAALSETLAGLRAETRATALAIALPADPAIRFETLVAAADAARQRGCGEPEGCRELFPDLLLVAAKTTEVGP